MQDLTSGKPAKVILMFAIPLMLGNMVQQLYNISDTLIVGQTLGVNSLAAVGATGSIQFLVMGFVQGFSSGMAIITAQRYGAQNVRGVRESYAASIVAALIMSLILTVVSLVFIDNLMHAMQMPAAIYGQAKLFLSLIHI